MANPLTPKAVLKSESPLALVAKLEPVGRDDRFQPAGFPEVGHVIYKAPRIEQDKDGKERVWEENVCIVDSAASMANHLESVCMSGAHDYDLVDDLAGMPYLRCVTGDLQDGKLSADKREVVVTSLTEGHRIASTYFLGRRNERTWKWDRKSGQRLEPDGLLSKVSFGDELASDSAFGIKPSAESKQAHPPAEKWWNVFRTILRYDPNALVHGVMFPQWQIKIPRVLTAYMEAFDAGRVDRAGVKFDRLGKTTSGQPIFAVDDATAREIRATFILDVALVCSFGRKKDGEPLGLTDKQKEFLIAMALWKIQKLLERPFRFRSGCHLRRVSLKNMAGEDIELRVSPSRRLPTSTGRMRSCTASRRRRGGLRLARTKRVEANPKKKTRGDPCRSSSNIPFR
jgi:CRISPR-associated protein Csb1